MCQFHGFVDFHRKPEIIGRDDQLFQCRLSRLSRRNVKNSPASRMRRRNISGLRAISQVISAIFGARKIEPAIEVLDRFIHLGVAEVGVVERGDLGAVRVDKFCMAFVEPAILDRLRMQFGSGIGRRQRDLQRMRD